MINETLEVQSVLQGQVTSSRGLYRAGYLMAKWHKAHGLTETQAREEISEWAEKHSFKLLFDLNNMIYQAYKDKRRLSDNPKICINADDIAEITRRFDKSNVRLVALGLLCYAKMFANANGEFSISLSSFAEWLGVNRGNLSARYIPELINFDYIKRDKSLHLRPWKKSFIPKALLISLNVPIDNCGDHELKGNDLHELYKRLF